MVVCLDLHWWYPRGVFVSGPQAAFLVSWYASYAIDYVGHSHFRQNAFLRHLMTWLIVRCFLPKLTIKNVSCLAMVHYCFFSLVGPDQELSSKTSRRVRIFWPGFSCPAIARAFYLSEYRSGMLWWLLSVILVSSARCKSAPMRTAILWWQWWWLPWFRFLTSSSNFL